MKVIVCGARDETDRLYVFRELDNLHEQLKITCVIHGAQRGVDSFAGQWAKSKGLEVVPVLAEWHLYGPKAGPLRNADMLMLGPEAVIAFPGGRGTRNMVMQARKVGLPIHRVMPTADHIVKLIPPEVRNAFKPKLG